MQPHQNYPIYAIILLAFALYLHTLAADSFWGDEILTAIFAQQSPPQIIQLTATDIHPPFYYLMVSGWAYLTLNPTQPTEATDWLWRFPSVIISLLTVALTYKLTPHLLPFDTFNQRNNKATAVALLLATAPIVVKYSQEARMHALFMGLSILTTWLLMQALRHHQWHYWLAFACATALNLYTVYFGFLILASQIIFVALLPSSPRPPSPRPSPKGRGSNNEDSLSPWERAGVRASLSPWERAGVRGHFALATIGAGILYLPWTFVLANILRRRAAVGAIEGGVGSPWLFLSHLVEALGPMPAPMAWAFLALYLLGLLSLLRHRAWPQAALLAAWLGLPALLPLLLGDPRALQFRYAFVIPMYLMGVVQGLSALIIWLYEYPQTYKVSKTLQVYLWQYAIWLLTTISFLATLNFYQQTKPDWRGAAAYLDSHAHASDLILIGPLWDEGRFMGYYYRGPAQLLTPAALVTNIERYAQTMRQNNGRLWAVNNFTPTESPFALNHEFTGVVLSEPQLNVYEPTVLTQVALDLAHQAVDGAYPWAEAARAQGVINPDPRTAKAAALKALGDTLVATQQLPAAIAAYQEAVTIFPGWVGGFMALAEAQEMAGNLSASAQAYQQAVAFNLKWQGAPADQAAKLVATKQWAEAIELYHQITK